MSLNPVFMSPGALFISLSPIFISQSSLLSCWSASSSLLAALNSWCISMHALFGLLRSLRCSFPCVLVVPVLLICFLHRSFISGNSWFISPNRYFIVSVFHIDFPEFFSFPYPRASFKVLNFSAYFPEFRRLLYFLVYFDRFVFICLFLWILICFSESEPLVFSSLAKTHQVVKLKRRPQWWQNAFVGYVNWREALKHIHYLLAIIESSIFVRSLVASLVVSHHWRRRCHLITYCSSASCCKEVRSPCFLFTLHGHIVKLVTASNFTRILTNENVSPDSSCSCRTLVLCTTMLKSFPRPSFLDCTRAA